MHRTTFAHTMHVFWFGLKVEDFYACVVRLSEYWETNFIDSGEKHSLGITTHGGYYAQVRVFSNQ